jgi:hypothetical protein
MVSIKRNAHFGYDVVVALAGRSVEAFCAASYPVLATFVGGLTWRQHQDLAHALHITWNEQAQINVTTVALGRIGLANLDAYLREESIVFHLYPDAPNYSWRWEDVQSYIHKLQSQQFQQQYEIAMSLAQLFS